MKTKKNKKSKPRVYTTFPLEENYRKAASDALLFMLSCEEFPFEKEKIDEACGDAAIDKFRFEEVVLTRGELRASAKAVEFSISCLSGDMSKYAFLENDFPGLLSDLSNSLSLLNELNPLFQELVQEVRKMK